MIYLDIKKKYQELISTEELLSYLNTILQNLDIDSSTDITILIDSDSVIKKMNYQYRGLNQPTDVLSFESNEINPETGNEILGDIIISIETAQKQANEADHPLINEVTFLIIHAILHLLGYDHDTKEAKQKMWSKQMDLMNGLGLSLNRISGDENFHD